MDTEKLTNDFKTAILDEMQKEILKEYDIPYCKWDSLIDTYKIIRHQIGIEDDIYYAVLENMYKTRKAVDNLQL